MKEKIIDEIYNLHLQNNTERTDFDRAFKYGIECAIEEIFQYIERPKISLKSVERPKSVYIKQI
jgi:hypothetical protein